VVAINDLLDADYLAYMLKYDSVHGRFKGEVSVDGNNLIVNGKTIRLTAERDPADLKWSEVDVDVVIESTGFFLTEETCQKHLDAGAKKVVQSAPSKDATPMFVYGVNHTSYAGQKIVSAASCTTNCLAPVAKVLLENFGIQRGLMTTIHSYTGDQRLLDFPHKDFRRARAAALSMIPTTTGAAKAVALVLPELSGKLNGLAIRVPTPNVSIVDLVATVDKAGINVSDVNEALKQASEGSLAGILGYSEAPLVSIDYNGCSLSSTVDAPTTYVIDNMVKVLSWYDNESGYSHRMVDLAAMVGKEL
jgi:glyceraldehyde 3-phosphate dehydrogenase